MKMLKIQVILCLLVASALAELNLELKIRNGRIKGVTGKSRGGRNYASFQGLRYAEPPERFKLAEPTKNWEGVRSAEKQGNACPQKGPGEMSLLGFRGSEDCLFLDVYTPKPEYGATLPVMVWIHGGAFVFGAGCDYRPDFFMDEDIVLVTINYRLAVFGFLYDGNDEILPANLGMKDQVLALQWVRDNIRFFGGDPYRVTIAGESAGSASVHYHILSPMSQGLFQAAIMQSGSALSPWAFNLNPKWTAKAFAEDLGCPSNDTQAMVDCLREKDEEELAELSTEPEWGPGLKFAWAPVVESPRDPTAAFLTKDPHQMVAQSESVSKVPLILGVNKNEGAFICSSMILADEELTQELNSSWASRAPLIFMYDQRKYGHVPGIEQVSTKIREHYFQNLDIDLSTEQRLTDVYSDWFFNYGVQKSAQAHSYNAPVYPYYFTRLGFSFMDVLDYETFEPPTHSDDIYYLFPFMVIPTPNTADAIEFSKNMVSLWASFARTGKPEKTWGAAKMWEPLDVEKNGMTWYRMDKHTQILGDIFGCRLRVWDDLLSNELKRF